MTGKPSCSQVRSLLIDTVWKETLEDGSAWKEDTIREDSTVPLREIPPWVASHLESCPGCSDFFREIQRLREWAIGTNMEIPTNFHAIVDAISKATYVSQCDEVRYGTMGVQPTGDGHQSTKAALQFIPLGMVGLLVNWVLLWLLKPLGFLMLNAILNWLTPFFFLLLVKYLPGVLREDPVVEKE